VGGQFSDECEASGFQSVHLWAHAGVDLDHDCVLRVCNEVARFHRKQGRGDYWVHYHHVDISASPSLTAGVRVRKGGITTGAGLLRPMSDLVAGVIPEKDLKRLVPQARPVRDDLVVLFMPGVQREPPQEYLDVAAKAHPDRCLWVFVGDESFMAERHFARIRNQLPTKGARAT